MLRRIPGGQGTSWEVVAAYFGGVGSGGAVQSVAVDVSGGSGRLFVFERARAWCVPRYNRTDGVGGGSLAFSQFGTMISFVPAGAPLGGALIVADVASKVIRVVPGGATGTDSYAITVPSAWSLFDAAMDRNGTLFAMDNSGSLYRLRANGTANPESAFSVRNGTALRIDRRDGAGLLFGSEGDASVYSAPASSGFVQSVVVSNVSKPVGLAVDLSGNIYVSDSPSMSVYRFGPTGGSGLSPTFSYGTFGASVWGIDVDEDENIYVTDGFRLIVATRAGPRFVLATVPVAACPAWEQGTSRVCVTWVYGISCFTPT